MVWFLGSTTPRKRCLQGEPPPTDGISPYSLFPPLKGLLSIEFTLCVERIADRAFTIIKYILSKYIFIPVDENS